MVVLYRPWRRRLKRKAMRMITVMTNKPPSPIPVYMMMSTDVELTATCETAEEQ